MGDPRVRLIVLFGGRSAEHDVSCVSARHVLAAVDPAKYRVEPVGITRDGEWVRAVDAADAIAAGVRSLPDHLTAAGPAIDPLPILATPGPVDLGPDSPPDGPTVAFPVLHGPMGEDGTIQGLLELADVAYVGAGVLGSALAMDKVAAKTHLQALGLAQARWRSFTLDDRDAADDDLRAEIDAIVADLGLPVFVKPANMGSSVGVSKASTPREIAVALRLAASYDRVIVIEEAVRGREIEVAVLGNDDPEASLPGEIEPGADFYDYADKYDDGAKLLVPAPLDDTEVAAARSLAIEAFVGLRIEGLARVDFFYEDDSTAPDGTQRGNRGWLVNELNTMPGFTPISMYPKLWDVSGLPYPKLIDRLVELAIERHDRRRRHTRTDHQD
jgi:D-alanine-D-alanine ligase